MRKLFILCAFLLQLLSPVYPQQATTATIEPNLKYGKPSKEELSLTSYAPDTTATAIISSIRDKVTSSTMTVFN